MDWFSDYIIQNTIYDSPQTSVYRALSRKDHQSMILKASKIGRLTPEIISRYKREYELTSKLNVAGTVKALGIEKTKEQIIIVFEDIGGESLDAILGRKMLTLEDILALAIRIIEIISHIQAANIIHKDINPSNIVFNPATDTLQIIDFDISSILSVETPVMKNPNVLEGTLEYISPEQTGRMNRYIDYRTDFYSFGVMLYEMLTGKKPFAADDPIEWVHCHIAKQPEPPAAVDSRIPEAVSAIVMKLMSKTAEDRYQSAIGIQSDLEFCLDHIRRDRPLDDFQISKHDIPDRFLIPGKLYGRDREIQTLMNAFDQTLTTDPFRPNKEILMVSGYSGIGKTALVKEIYKTITPKRGYFISGKCSQFQGDIPYNAFVMAFGQLIRQILTEHESRLGYLKEQLLEALGTGGRVIIDVVPEFERVIGPQPELEPLPPKQAQNRLNLVAKNFMMVFCRPEHPLVVFFDDLQWADAATLHLLSLMIKDTDINHLFFIGTYRDNEVFPDHPLMTLLEDLARKKIPVTRIALSPLNKETTTTLLADTFHQDRSAVSALAGLVTHKTGGNPFFINEFLKMLHRNRHLVFDLSTRTWKWDLSQIANLSLTDNVVDLMLKKIQLLPVSTQKVLGGAACIGNPFNLVLLSRLNETVASETMKTLQPALTEGLIIPISRSKINTDEDIVTSELVFHTLQFVHDRFHQAAYALTTETQKKRFHLKLGRILYQMTPPAKLPESIFEITDHLNAGSELITDPVELLDLVRLNLDAGRKAKDSSANASSLAYFKRGMALLKAPWQPHTYALSLAIHQERITSEYINGHFEQAENLIQDVIQKAASDMDRAELYCQLIVLYTMQARYREAIAAGTQALDLLDIHVPENNLETALTTELQAAQKNLENIVIPRLIEAPEMTDPEKKIAMKILMNLNATAYFVDKNLYAWILVKMTNIALIHGKLPEAAKGYTSYGNILVSILGDYQTGYEFGLLGVKLSEKYNNLAYKCQCCMALTTFINHWVKPLKESDQLSAEGYQAGLKSGELQYAGYILLGKIVNLFYQGKHLDQIIVEADRYLEFTQKTKNQLAYDIILGCKLGITNLTGQSPAPYDFKIDEVDETTYLKNCETHQTFAGICLYKIMKAQILLLYGRYKEAHQSFEEAKPLFSYILGIVAIAGHHFYDALCLATLIQSHAVEESADTLNQIETYHQQIQIWAGHCPENFKCMGLVLGAEKAAMTQDHDTAMDLYDQAIASAAENGLVQIEALANELAAKFWQKRDKPHFAALYLQNARKGYLKWGAVTKVRALEETSSDTPEYSLPNGGQPLARRPSKMPPPPCQQSSDYFDQAALIDAYQAISSDIELNSLLKKLMNILTAYAGARKGILILKKNESFWVEALASVKTDNVRLISIKLADYDTLARSVTNYVIRTGDSVVLHDAAREGMFARDPYILKHTLRSICCLPIIHHGFMTGLLYLENRLNTGVFTASRLKMLELLASQAAISIENAKLYTMYRSLYDNAVEGIFQSTPDGRLTQANQTVAKMFGYESPSEAINSITNLEKQLYVVPEDRQRFLRFIKEDGKVLGFETRFYRKDRSVLWVSLSARGIYDTNNQLTYYEGSVLDITQRKNMEKAEQERAAAEAASNAKSDFLAKMSHEIRTPMNGVIATVDLALDEPLSPKLSHYLEIIKSSGQSLLSIINDILDFSKIEAGKLDLEKQPFNLDDLIKNTSNLFFSKFTQKQLSLYLDIQPDIPLALQGDPLRIQQILTNLMGNALKFTDQGSIQLTVTAKPTDDPREMIVSFALSDTGTGMTRDQVRKIFNPFSQADLSTTRKFGGTGLGLSITKVLVEMMNGKIWVKSVPNRGTTFYFTLCLRIDDRPAPPLPARIPANITGWPVLALVRNPPMRTILDKMLASFKFKTRFVTTESEALKRLRAEQASPSIRTKLIIIDQEEAQTEQATEYITFLNAISPQIPVLILTPRAVRDSRSDAHMVIPHRGVSKPITPSILFDAIMDVLENPTLKIQKTEIEIDLRDYKTRLNGRHLLLVEDNTTNQEIAQAVMNTAGIKVTVANNGKEAVEMLFKRPNPAFDLVLMDIQMPYMDGYEATRTIRNHSAFLSLPIVAMTAHAIKGDREKCLEAGMNDYVTKPINQLNLFQTLSKYISPSPLLPTEGTTAPPGSAPPPPQPPPDGDVLFSLPGIETHSAMKSLGLPPRDYEEVLHGFSQSNQDTAARLKDAYTAKDLKKLAALAHALKGSGFNLGMKRLGRAAQKLEASSQIDNIEAFDVRLFDNMLATLDEVMTSVALLNRSPEGNKITPVPSQDMSYIHAIIQEIAEYLSDCNPDGAQKGAAILKSLLHSPAMNQLAQHIDNYNFEQALRILKAIAQDIGVIL